MSSFCFWVTDWGEKQIYKLFGQLAHEKGMQCLGGVS